MQKAFTLVELSVVLVILGLLTGGILAGQALIKGSELRTVTTETNRWMTAASVFSDKYGALPGDLSDATRYWGAADTNAVACLTAVGTGTQTCNGNGDGMVNRTEALGFHEFFRFWQHLANAGLIEGNYHGRIGPGGAAHTTVDNAPKSKFGVGMWFTAWQGPTTGFNVAGDSIFTGDYGNYLELGAPTANFHPQSVLLSPEEMWNLDTKMDDGKPATGRVIARRYDTCTNATGFADYAADYLFGVKTPGCVFLYMRAY